MFSQTPVSDVQNQTTSPSEILSVEKKEESPIAEGSLVTTSTQEPPAPMSVMDPQTQVPSPKPFVAELLNSIGIIERLAEAIPSPHESPAAPVSEHKQVTPNPKETPSQVDSLISDEKEKEKAIEMNEAEISNAESQKIEHKEEPKPKKRKHTHRLHRDHKKVADRKEVQKPEPMESKEEKETPEEKHKKKHKHNVTGAALDGLRTVHKFGVNVHHLFKKKDLFKKKASPSSVEHKEEPQDKSKPRI